MALSAKLIGTFQSERVELGTGALGRMLVILCKEPKLLQLPSRPLGPHRLPAAQLVPWRTFRKLGDCLSPPEELHAVRDSASDGGASSQLQ